MSKRVLDVSDGLGNRFCVDAIEDEVWIRIEDEEHVCVFRANDDIPLRVSGAMRDAEIERVLHLMADLHVEGEAN